MDRGGISLARNLTFAVAGGTIAAEPVKIDRTKLYGWTETVALDGAGNPCELALIDRSGTTLIPKGGTGLGLLDQQGNWVDRSTLDVRNADGSPAEQHPSSYDEPIALDQRASVEDLLDTPVSAVYQLQADAELLSFLGEDIYTFDYYYRAGTSGSRAFLLAQAGTAFLLTGQPATFAFVGLDAEVDVVDEGDDDDDDLDFGMM
jgi:hypothetical protein